MTDVQSTTSGANQKKRRSRAGKRNEERSAQQLITGDDYGESNERELSARAGAERFGFGRFPSQGVDTQSDLNSKIHGDNPSVDSIAGGDSSSDADELTDFDTITDSNTLTSAAKLSGAFMTGDPFDAKSDEKSEAANYDEIHEDDFFLAIDEDEIVLSEDEDELEARVAEVADLAERRKSEGNAPSHLARQDERQLEEGLDVDAVRDMSSSNLGLTEGSDEKTVRRYIDKKKGGKGKAS